jgi:predicted phage terminase large subunit-like protein
MREQSREDLFFLLVWLLRRQDANRDWVWERCQEFQADPDGYLDEWARFHYKSTIVTFAGSIQEILNNQNVRICIFSHTRPIAKGFLRQIKREFETNDVLKSLFPDILWRYPLREAPKWSEDDGIVVKRTTNAKEATVEAFGLVDGQPTSRHYDLRVYDDVVTLESVTTPEQMAKTTAAWEVSLALTTEGGRERYVGTRYHFGDTWGELLRRGAVKDRKHPVYEVRLDGTVTDKPVLLDPVEVADIRKKMGPYTFACQMLLNPLADEAQGFRRDWLMYWEPMGVTQKDPGWTGMNRYILVDPANAKKKDSDYTVMVVVGLGPDGNIYLVDGIRDRMNLAERTRTLFRLHRKYRPRGVGYEHYGMQADIQHIQQAQAEANYRFEVTPLGGRTPKHDRIRRLVPDFEAHRIYIPWRAHFVDYEGRQKDFVQMFVDEEYLAFPVGVHDDMLDAFSRIKDPELGAVYPRVSEDPLVLGQQQGRQAQMDYDVLAGA